MDNLEAAWTFVPGMTKQAAPSAWVAKSYLDEKGGTLILYTEFLFDEMPFVWEEFSRVWAPVLEKKLDMMVSNLITIYSKAGAVGARTEPVVIKLGKAPSGGGICLQGAIRVKLQAPAEVSIQSELVTKLKALEFKLLKT